MCGRRLLFSVNPWKTGKLMVALQHWVSSFKDLNSGSVSGFRISAISFLISASMSASSDSESLSSCASVAPAVSYNFEAYCEAISMLHSGKDHLSSRQKSLRLPLGTDPSGRKPTLLPFSWHMLPIHRRHLAEWISIPVLAVAYSMSSFPNVSISMSREYSCT